MMRPTLQIIQAFLIEQGTDYKPSIYFSYPGEKDYFKVVSILKVGSDAVMIRSNRDDDDDEGWSDDVVHIIPINNMIISIGDSHVDLLDRIKKSVHDLSVFA